MTFDQFIKSFKPIVYHSINESYDGYMLETFGEDLNIVLDTKRHCVWTVMEEDGTRFLSNDYHIVNRIGYIITKVPWDEELIIEL